MTKTKIALAALLVAGTASAALAQGEFDPNPANRYPAYAAPGAYAPLRAGAAEPGPHDPRGAACRSRSNWVPAPAHAGGVG